MPQLTLRDLANKLRSVAHLADAAQRMQAEIVEAAVADVKDRMAAGVQPDGTPQPPIKYKRRSGNTGPPLVDYGKLRESVSGEVAGVSLFLTARGPGARKHQETRPFLGVTPTAAKTLARLMLTGILRGLKT